MKRYGLIGKSLVHSFSKDFFQKKFAAEQIAECSYDNFELPSIDLLPSFLQNNPDVKGLNVTIPYKEQVIDFLHEQSPVVETIGACNCIRIDDGKLAGFNTDVVGFEKSLLKKLQPHHRGALILGTGGASKAVAYVLKEMGIGYYFVSRKKKDNELGYEDLNREIFETHHLIINCTPLGTSPNVHEDPPIPYQYLNHKHLLFDLIYNPPKTKFLTEGEKRGATIMNGYEMLVLQAEESWKIWNSLSDGVAK